MAFQQGVSGLYVFGKALDVVSHNIANASTVGFKSSEAQFADVYAGALNGSSSTQIGIGARLMAVQQKFVQGNISSTGNSLDMAINGNGFFRFQKSANDMTAYYSRNGQFHLNKEGYIENSNSCLLTGFACQDGVNINYASIVPLSIGSGSIPPEQTGWSTEVNFGAGGGLMVGLNLDRRDTKALTITDPEWSALQPFAWDGTFSADMFNYSSSVTVYDQSGTAHTLTNYFVRAGDTGDDERTWNVYTAIDGKYLVDDGSGTPYMQLVFNYNGTLDRIQDPRVATPNDVGSRYALDLSQTIHKGDAGPPVIPAGTAANLMSEVGTYDKPWFRDTTSGNGAFYMDLSNTTQFGTPFDVVANRQDGYLPGNLSNITISQTGHIVAGYSNGQTKLMGQVLLVEFDNPHGLQSAGDNLWIETWDSGQPTIGQPGGGTRGIIQGQSVEESNTDLTQELVNMIIYQRNYQANAQTIRTQDQIMQTLVNLR